MKKSSYLLIFMIIILSLFFFSSFDLQAAKREVMVGDIIKLEINAPGLSKFDLINEFRDYEIVNFDKTGDNTYIISFRIFETGIKNISIGNKNVKIEVTSLLDKLNRNKIYEPDLNLEREPLYIFLGLIITGIITLLLCIRLVILLKNVLNKSNSDQILAPYKLIEKRIMDIDEQDCYFSYITYVFKEYIENIYGINLLNKSPDEIVDRLANYDELSDLIGDIDKWLSELEGYKYREINVKNEVKQKAKSDLLKFVRLIEEVKNKKQNEIEKG